MNQSHPTLNRSPFATVNIGGLDIACAGRAELAAMMTADCLAARAENRVPETSLAFDANGHGLSLAATDPAYRAAVTRADIIHADGGFLVTLAKLFGSQPIRERSATTDMFHDLAEAAAGAGLSFYLLGGSEAVNAECARIMQQRYPGLNIVGRRHGYFTPAEEPGIIDHINAVRPDLLWVGIGKPKEQLFAVKYRDRLRAVWLITCGGCFNYITGDYRRAPLWMQKYNLEWLHRAVCTPRKLLLRYLTTNPHALWLALTKSKW